MSVVTSIKWSFTYITHQIKLFETLLAYEHISHPHLLTVDYTSTDYSLFTNLQKVMMMLYCSSHPLSNQNEKIDTLITVTISTHFYIQYSCKQLLLVIEVHRGIKLCSW